MNININENRLNIVLSFQLVDLNRKTESGKTFSKVFKSERSLKIYLVSKSDYNGVQLLTKNFNQHLQSVVKESIKLFKNDSKRRQNRVKVYLKDDKSLYVFVKVMI